MPPRNGHRERRILQSILGHLEPPVRLITQTDMDRYIDGLSSEMQHAFRIASLVVRHASDTLSEDFQLAAAIVALFEQRAAAYFLP